MNWKKRKDKHFFKIILKLLLFLMFLYLLPSKQAAASTMGFSEIDYSEIQEVLDEIMDYDNNIKFGDYVDRIISGEETFSIVAIAENLIEGIKAEVRANITMFAQILSIALFAAVFTNLSMAFKNNQVSETGYYITYLLLFALIMSSFVVASITASNVITKVLNFMKVLVPSYSLSIGFCSGTGSSLIYYEFALILISLAEFIIIKVVIPLINFYMLIVLANNLSKEDMLSRLAALLESVIGWILKSLLAAVIGMQAIQGLITPVIDEIKRSSLLKASETLPGIGVAFGGLAETVLSAGVLLKNSIGVAGLIVIVVICALPTIKILVIALIYKFTAAILQPVSDKRIVDCIGGSAKSTGLLLRTILIAAVLFMLSITIVAVSTSTVI